MIKVVIIILINDEKKFVLNEKYFLKTKYIKRINELNHDEIVVAIGIIINPILSKKYRLIEIFITTDKNEK